MLAFHPKSDGKALQGSSGGMCVVGFVLESPRLLFGGWTVGGRSEAGRPVLGGSELSTYTCPDSKEAYVYSGIWDFSSYFRGWKRGGQGTAEAAGLPGSRARWAQVALGVSQICLKTSA